MGLLKGIQGHKLNSAEQLIVFQMDILQQTHEVKRARDIKWWMQTRLDVGAGGKFEAIRRQFVQLKEIRPNFGYYPESSKSILIVPQHNYDAALDYFSDLTFMVTTESRYLGGFIGDNNSAQEWIQEKMNDWEAAIAELASTCHKYPQSAYSGL
jgi:hypothetical protein